MFVADHSGRVIYCMNSLCMFECCGGSRFESHLRLECLLAFNLFVLSCVEVEVLRRVNPPSKVSCRLYERFEKAANAQD